MKKVVEVVKAIGAWVVQRWRFVAVAVFFALALGTGRKVLIAVKSRLGTVKGGMPFVPIDDTHVAVKGDAGWITVDLPKGVVAKDVRAIGATRGVAVVEVKHAHADRRR